MSTRLIPTGTCDVANSYQVPMTITVESVGDTLTVSARSDPDPTIQYCDVNGPADGHPTTGFDPVSVSADGGSNSADSTASTCLEGLGDADADVRCKFTVTATKLPD